MGLDDLANSVARTPLAPKQTFHDDPLRVLRCIRFASRFDLNIAEEVKDAMRDEGIKVGIVATGIIDVRLRCARKYQRSGSESRLPR